jgi:hypothetical protein
MEEQVFPSKRLNQSKSKFRISNKEFRTAEVRLIRPSKFDIPCSTFCGSKGMKHTPEKANLLLPPPQSRWISSRIRLDSSPQPSGIFEVTRWPAVQFPLGGDISEFDEDLNSSMDDKRKRSFEVAATQRSSGPFAEYLRFLSKNRKYWLIPVVAVLFLIGLLVMMGGSVAGAFVYTFF